MKRAFLSRRQKESRNSLIETFFILRKDGDKETLYIS